MKKASESIAKLRACSSRRKARFKREVWVARHWLWASPFLAQTDPALSRETLQVSKERPLTSKVSDLRQNHELLTIGRAAGARAGRLGRTVCCVRRRAHGGLHRERARVQPRRSRTRPRRPLNNFESRTKKEERALVHSVWQARLCPTKKARGIDGGVRRLGNELQLCVWVRKRGAQRDRLAVVELAVVLPVCCPPRGLSCLSSQSPRRTRGERSLREQRGRFPRLALRRAAREPCIVKIAVLEGASEERRALDSGYEIIETQLPCAPVDPRSRVLVLVCWLLVLLLFFWRSPRACVDKRAEKPDLKKNSHSRRVKGTRTSPS